jgi:hypothetical protein
MSVSAINQKIAASSTGGQTEACKTCPSAGLPILLTRYGIDPEGLDSNPPKFSNGYTPPKLGRAGRHLRVLREGFVYVALQYDSAPGKVFWMCYLVDSSGLLKVIPAASPPPAENKIACVRKEHSVNAALIAIPAPEFVHTAHLAFTELKWDQATLDDYEKIILGKKGAPKTGRSIQRFVSISPKSWVPNGANLAPAPNVWAYAKVGHVVEYRSGLSDLDAQKLENTTGFHCTPRRTAAELVTRMNALRLGRGMVLALPDPIGEAKELNVLRMQAYQEFRAYSSDEDLKWKAQSAQLIEGIKAGAEKLAEEQASRELERWRDRAPMVPPIVVRQKAENLRAEYLDRAFEPIKGEYDEEAQAAFLSKYQAQLQARYDTLVAHDTDYVAAMDAPHVQVVLSDFDESIAGQVCCTVVIADALAGGGITDVSLEWCRKTLELPVQDRKNLLTLGSLGGHKPLIEALELSDTAFASWLFEVDSSSRAKAVDILRGVLLHDKVRERFMASFPQIASNTLNTIESLKRRFDVQKSKAAKLGVRTKTALEVSVLKMSDASYARLCELQKKLVRGFAAYSAGLHMVTLKMKVTPEELLRYAEAFGDHAFNIVSRHSEIRKLKAGEQGAKPKDRFKIDYKKEFHSSLKDYVLNDAQLAKDLKRGAAEVEFAIMGTRAELEKVLAEMLSAELTAKITAHSEEASRAIALVEASAATRIAALQKLPQRLSNEEVAQLVTRLGAHAGRFAASLDVGFTGAALIMNYMHLANMTRDLVNSDAFTSDEARVAFASAVLGASGVSVEMLGRAGKVIEAFDKAGAKLAGEATEAAAQRASGALARFGASRFGAGMVARAGVLIGIGTLLGSFAVALDSVQMGMVAKDSWSSGDIDAFAFNVGGSIAFAGAAVALFASAGAEGGIAALSGAYAAVNGLTALAGITPITAGIALLLIGVLFAYLAFTAKDKPLTTWVKRSRFGDDARNRFKSMEAELGALQLVNLAFEIHLRWDDRPISDIVFADLPEEVEITIEYPANARGTLVYGLVVSGVGGRACFTPVGVGALDVNTVDLPRMFDASQCPRYNADAEIPADDSKGGGYNHATMVLTGTSVVSGDEVKQDGGVQRQGAGVEEASRISDSDLSGLKQDETHRISCRVVHTWQIDADRFDTAELHIRYFPDASEPKKYVDTVYSVRD